MSHKARKGIDPVTIRKEMGLDKKELDKMKSFLEFSDEDVKRLRSLHAVAKKYIDTVIDNFYRHLLSFEDAKKFFQDPETLEYVKNKQRGYFLQMTEGEYDEKYAESRILAAAIHEVIGVPKRLYLGMYIYYTLAARTEVYKAFPNDSEHALAMMRSLTKLIFFDISIAVDTFVHNREMVISRQQESIRELSTPVLQLRDGLLILPIIGTIETNRARQLTEQLLESIRANRAKVVIMDITGVPSVDTNVANHLIQTVEAARLMGATVIITGLSAEVAQTVVTLGVDLSKLRTIGDLQRGIDEADRILGYKVQSEKQSTDIQ